MSNYEAIFHENIAKALLMAGRLEEAKQAKQWALQLRKLSNSSPTNSR